MAPSGAAGLSRFENLPGDENLPEKWNVDSVEEKKEHSDQASVWKWIFSVALTTDCEPLEL